MLRMGPRDDESAGGDSPPETLIAQGRLSDRDIGERWVAEDDVESPARPRIQVCDHVRCDDFGSRGEVRRLEIPPERFYRLPAALDERRVNGAARERFDPERPRAGEQVEDPRPLELGLEDRKQRLADPIG